MSFRWVRRSGGRGVHGAVLTGGKSILHRALHLFSKLDCPLSGGMDLLWVLWHWIVFQMVLVVAFWCWWMRYAVLALRTIVVHLQRLYWLSCLLALVGESWALLSAHLVVSFTSVRLWFHQGTSLFLGFLYGMAVSVASIRKKKLRSERPDALDTLNASDATCLTQTQFAMAPCIRTQLATAVCVQTQLAIASAYWIGYVRAFSFWMQPCQDIFLLDTAVSGHFPSGHSCVRANGVRTTRVMALRSCWLSRHRTSQQILLSHSQTCSGFQA